MAKRYSKTDQSKMVNDRLQEMHAKGVIDYGTFTPLHPGGAVEAIKVMEQDAHSTRDQSQEQRGLSSEKARQAARDSQASAEQIRDQRKKG
jgi:hypothetical protein